MYFPKREELSLRNVRAFPKALIGVNKLVDNACTFEKGIGFQQHFFYLVHTNSTGTYGSNVRHDDLQFRNTTTEQITLDASVLPAPDSPLSKVNKEVCFRVPNNYTLILAVTKHVRVGIVCKSVPVVVRKKECMYIHMRRSFVLVFALVILNGGRLKTSETEL
jgi:hypothetical protein